MGALIQGGCEHNIEGKEPSVWPAAPWREGCTVGVD